MTKQEAQELINEIGAKISYFVFWAGMVWLAIELGEPYLEAHNEHGKPVYEAAAKGDAGAIDIIRSAAKGDAFSRWTLGQ